MTDNERIAKLEKRAERAEAYFRDKEEEQAAVLPEDWSLADWANAQRKRIAELESLLATANSHRLAAISEANRQEDRADAMEADRDRLREALNCYGAHDPDCASIDQMALYGQSGEACTCGLDTALTGTGEPEHPDTVSRPAILKILDEHETTWKQDSSCDASYRDGGLGAVEDIRAAIDALPELEGTDVR